jgi:hypothetical protein
VTEDSQNRVRGYGPFPEGAEPTEQIPVQDTGDQAIPSPLPRSAEAGHDPDSSPEESQVGPRSQSPPPTGIYESQAAPWIPSPGPPPTLGPPAPTSSTDHYRAMSPSISGAPISAAGSSPAAQDPFSAGPPSSAISSSTHPNYGPFHNGPDSAPSNDAPDEYGLSTPPGRRIEPSPPPQKSRLLLGLAAGLLTGLLLFGTAGWLTARATATTDEPAKTPTTLGVFEQNQIKINGADFQGTTLTPLARGWLPYVATCNRSGTPGGPALSPGEKARVRCTLDGMSAIFIQYNDIKDRDKARAALDKQAGGATTLTPGAAPPTQRQTPSKRTTGNYVEYAYRVTERGTTRTVSGIWWDDAKTPVAGYLLAYWKEGVGRSWGPMRDLWSRYA